ncbi:MAG: tRNA (guanine37-N1)-methyltransferase [Patescibacteria group bacterium]|jgi:tRNA (guanine37-N1)-methyltransferase|nr:tRNA (guanine37-N1)-methyltransferase [Patescibacteria group bacterium]
MHFDILSIFPESFESYFGVSILKRAKEDGLINISLHDLRAFTHDKHHKVDDTPYGGGAGMVMKAEPFFEAVESISSQQLADNNKQKTRVILFSAKGKVFTQADAKRLSEYDRLILLCGRYEGVDERVAEHLIDEEISIGEYVLTGGELPAMIVVDAVARLLPGVLGNSESSVDESHSEEGVLEYSHYTKPEEFRGWKVPEILLSGHHADIEKWRKEQSQKISNF